MTETALVILNNSMEALGISALCQSADWKVAEVRLVSDFQGETSFAKLPDHTVVIIAVGPTDVKFLTDQFVPFYQAGAKTCVLLRNDVTCDAIQNLEHEFFGIIDSSAAVDKIADAFRLISNGYHVTDFAFEDQHATRVGRGGNMRMDTLLSEREMEIGQEVAAGLTNKEIALRLDISVNTVNAHLAAIRHKLDLRNRTEIALWMYKNADRVASSA